MGGETRYNKDSIFHLERQRGITSEAHSDGQQADDAEIAQDGRLRRVPGIVPVRMQDELHGRQPGLRNGEMTESFCHFTIRELNLPFGNGGRFSYVYFGSLLSK